MFNQKGTYGLKTLLLYRGKSEIEFHGKNLCPKIERKISLQGTGSIQKKLCSSIELIKIRNKSRLVSTKRVSSLKRKCDSFKCIHVVNLTNILIFAAHLVAQ